MSMLTLASDKPAVNLTADTDPIAAVTAVGYLHAKVEQQAAGQTAHATCELTPKQALCLKWAA
ncbi:hypothetical protein ACI4BE_28340, partial [Klebsiella pneumoniae]|uniref:hypothetical protein n=1 Tax=Klebsiella pneumoniae TaxID=573 RepID=UPI0038524345